MTAKKFWAEFYKDDPNFPPSEAACEFAEAYTAHLRREVEGETNRADNNADEAAEHLAAKNKAERDTSDIRKELERYTENKQVGQCCDCGMAIWFREARITDDSGTYHPLCRVAKERDEAREQLKAQEWVNAGIHYLPPPSPAVYGGIVSVISKDGEPVSFRDYEGRVWELAAPPSGKGEKA